MRKIAAAIAVFGILLYGSVAHALPQYNIDHEHAFKYYNYEAMEEMGTAVPGIHKGDNFFGLFYVNPIRDLVTTDETWIQKHPSYENAELTGVFDNLIVDVTSAIGEGFTDNGLDGVAGTNDYGEGNNMWDFVDSNNNNQVDPGEAMELFVDGNGNGVWDGTNTITYDTTDFYIDTWYDTSPDFDATLHPNMRSTGDPLDPSAWDLVMDDGVQYMKLGATYYYSTITVSGVGGGVAPVTNTVTGWWDLLVNNTGYEWEPAAYLDPFGTPVEFKQSGRIYNDLTAGWQFRSEDPIQGTPIPEPATMLLLGSGLVGLSGLARRKRKK